MNITDPVSDLLTRLRNAIRAGHEKTDIPASRQCEAILALLAEEGYIGGYRSVEEGRRRLLRTRLKYDGDGQPVIGGLTRVSKVGRRVYRRASEIPPVLGGLGIAVISTSRGLVTDRKARQDRLGGEVLFNIW